MRIRLAFALAMAAASGMYSGCSSKGMPVDYANICDPANNKKVVEVSGYFNPVRSVMCSTSKSVPWMTCPVPFVNTPGANLPLTANIDLGKGANQIDKEQLQIRDDKGAIVPGTQKVTITAKVSVFTPPPRDKKEAPCYLMVVKKIETR